MANISSLCLFFMVGALVPVLARTSEEHCVDENFSCPDTSPDFYLVPEIRFPFRVRDKNQSNCGYPGFDLICNRECQLVLELPSTPIKLGVVNISYYNQEVEVRVPDTWLLLMKPRFDLLNLSSSPFRFTYGFSCVTLLNCSVRSIGYGREMACISDGLYHELCVTSAKTNVSNNLNLINCTKMYDYYAPLDPDNYFTSLMGRLSLTWSKPNCALCERQQNGCRLKKHGAEHETECFDRFKHGKAPLIKSSVIAGSTSLGSFLVLMMFVAAFYVYTNKNKNENQLRIKKFLEDYIALKPARYSYADIKKITTQFKEKLGEGAYGAVFKGKLSSEILVAVKILNNNKGNGEEFINEVATMGQIHHVNVVRLVGYCADGFRRALVYEFLPNDSLDKYISGAATNAIYSLSWEKLQNIALGTAKGIEYLHQGCDQRILHFDIKPHNVLLDQNFSPKISDFGLAKLCSKDQSIVSMSTARGTMGYIAPEVFSRNFGSVSYKSDIYSFGMLLLEMVGGRKVDTKGKGKNGTDEFYYPEWIYNLLEEGEDLRIQIEGEEDAKIARKLAIVGLCCIQWHPVGRPTMKAVVQMLEGDDELAMPPNPFAPIGPSKRTSKMPARRNPLELEAIAE